MYIRITQKQMIGDTQVMTVRGYDLGLLDSYYIYYQAICFVWNQPWSRTTDEIKVFGVLKK